MPGCGASSTCPPPRTRPTCSWCAAPWRFRSRDPAPSAPGRATGAGCWPGRTAPSAWNSAACPPATLPPTSGARCPAASRPWRGAACWASTRDGPRTARCSTPWTTGGPWSATDYQPDDTYILGRVAAANVLDSARAATQLGQEVFGPDTPDRYDMMTWGHSQGGHAALWAGQLAETYLEGTEPSRPTPTIELAGVAALAPAGNFVAEPGDQPGVAYGDGLADWEMHEGIPELLNLPIPALELQIGPALFSFIFGSWSQFAAAATDPHPTPSSRPHHRTPPSRVLEDIATPPGSRPSTRSCRSAWPAPTPRSSGRRRGAVPERGGAPDVAARAVEPARRLLGGRVLPGWRRHGLRHRDDAGLQCGATGSASTCPARWATTRSPRSPSVGRPPVPLLMAQGTDDEVIHCVDAGAARPTTCRPRRTACRRPCTTRSDRRPTAPTVGPEGHLQLDLARPEA